MMKTQATKLQPSSKLNGGEGSCKFEGDVLWEGPNSTKLCLHNVWCPYDVSIVKLKLFHQKNHQFITFLNGWKDMGIKHFVAHH
jgi:hypothetical protein